MPVSERTGEGGARVSIQSTIEAAAGALSPSQARVAAVIRADPSVVLDSTINELAERCDTSVASVVRFCRSIGFSGYAQLRMALATEIGKESAQFGGSISIGADIGEGDSLAEITAKIASLEILAIEETLANLDIASLEQAVSLIDGAERVLLYGLGASQFIAADLGHKLLRIARPAFVLSDPHEAWASAALLIPGTVAIGFSHRGETVETINFLRIASEAGAPTIALTNSSDSAIARVADCLLLTEAREPAFRAGAMVSRIAQLAVVDCVFAGVAQRRYAQTVEALRLTREATRRPSA